MQLNCSITCRYQYFSYIDTYQIKVGDKMKIEMSTSNNLLTLSNLTINEIEEIRQLVVKLNLKRELRDMYG